MWEFEHSLETSAGRDEVWAMWSDVPGWSSWNPGVGRAELDGPLAAGARGTVRSAGGPASRLTVLEVEPRKRLVTEATERMMRLRFEHEIADADDGKLRLTERVQMTGAATPLMKHTVGRRLQRSIPEALNSLVERAGRIDGNA